MTAKRNCYKIIFFLLIFLLFSGSYLHPLEVHGVMEAVLGNHCIQSPISV